MIRSFCDSFVNDKITINETNEKQGKLLENIVTVLLMVKLQ